MFTSKMALPYMTLRIFLLLLFLQGIPLSFSFSLHKGNDTDKLSLLAFKAGIIVDPLHIVSSWNESLHFCKWPGVTCGRRHQRVIELNLRSSKLVGSLSPHIGNLSFLRVMDLRNNSLSNNLPQELGRLFRLQELYAGGNIFSGKIPINISHCSNLVYLFLNNNNFTGEIPGELESLSKLQSIVFDKNNLIGKIPSSFGNLSFLQAIYGIHNHLWGVIPNSIGQLERLENISLSSNNLSGMIPTSIYNKSSLSLLGLRDNQLYGSLPPNLGLTLPNIKIFNIASNRFSGIIPVTMSNASNLFRIGISNNNFSGKVPTLANLYNLEAVGIGYNNLGDGDVDDLNFLYSLANNTNLKELGIHDNNFGGVLPRVLGNFSRDFEYMMFGRNQIWGSIPTEMGNLVGLQILGIEENLLTGAIPSSFGKLQKLVLLTLLENKISGGIPFSIGNMTSLTELYLNKNNLQGGIPSSFGRCQKLLSVSLSQNNLSGPIPKEIIGIPSLSLGLDLSANQLTGSIPSEVGKLVNLGYLNISNNKLFGMIPESLGSCWSLEYLYMDKNSFEGAIPQSLSSLRAIRELNLSCNNFTGKIPMYLAEFKLLEVLDLSFNNFEGEVAIQGVFLNSSAVSVFGNKKLCGGIPQLNLPKCNSTKPKSFTKLTLIVSITCGLLGLISLVFFILLCHFKRRKRKAISQSPLEHSFRRVSYQDLSKATNGFSSTNLIGVGSFGLVYRGILEQDRMTIAVKVLNLLHKGGSKSFAAECQALASIRHRNLVKLISVCSSIDFQALVYEFMVNGSLEEWLHPVCDLHQTHQSRNLSFCQRLNVAIDVASALEYLHHDCQISIVHCDLKPNNILLDVDMTAHVGDFGLARLLPDAFHKSSSDQSSSIGIKGTIGYVAPEYGMRSEVSTYGDVYSYGILLLEMFTGKKPIDSMFNDQHNLHSFTKMGLENNVKDIIDPILLHEYEETSASTSSNVNSIRSNKILECCTSILKIGVACSEQTARDRMDMKSVVAALHRIKHMLLVARRR